jgi:hypothetical protein
MLKAVFPDLPLMAAISSIGHPYQQRFYMLCTQQSTQIFGYLK